MNIMPQMKLFEESDFENIGDLERLQWLLSVLDDGKLIRPCVYGDGKSKNTGRRNKAKSLS